MPYLDPAVLDVLKQKGYDLKVKEPFAYGFESRVYSVIHSETKRDCVMKVCHRPDKGYQGIDDHARAAVIAGKLKIGPQIYESGAVQSAVESLMRYCTYSIMDHVHGESLQSRYFKTDPPDYYKLIPHFITAISLYRRLFEEGKVLQDDFHVGNILIDEACNKRTYIIDYGMSCENCSTMSKSDFAEHVVDVIKKYMISLIHVVHRRKNPAKTNCPPWRADETFGKAWLSHLKTLLETAKKWVSIHYPLASFHMQIQNLFSDCEKSESGTFCVAHEWGYAVKST